MNKYENLGVVGEGSYGIVMKCRHKNSGEIVAVKKFLETDDDQLIKKIAMREINMLRKLRHDNLVNLIEVFRRKGHLYLVLEYVNHTVLDELEQHPGGLGEEMSREYVWQILRGLHFCHSHNIVHRDVKPENVLVSNMGVIKLCDFGFARMLSSSGESCTDYVATRWYRAPELLVGDTRYGREVDVWASGCLLAEMITGEALFPGESDIDQLFCIMRSVGSLAAKHQTMMLRSPMFQGMRYQLEVTKPLVEKFASWPKLTLQFLQECLEMDPDKRASTGQLLEHSYFLWDGFTNVFLPELQRKLQVEFSGSLAFSKSNAKDEPGRKSSAGVQDSVQLAGKDDDMLNNKPLTPNHEHTILPPCSLLPSRTAYPLRPPTKIAPLTPSKSQMGLHSSSLEGSSPQNVIPTFIMPPISQVGSTNPKTSFEIKRNLSPRSSHHSKNKDMESLQNPTLSWMTMDQSQKPMPTYLRKNNELLPIAGAQSDSPAFDLGIVHGEKSFLHNRSFSMSSKKKTKGDTSSLGSFGQMENDSALPNITQSPGPFSPTKTMQLRNQRLTFNKGIMPSINRMPELIQHKHPEERLQSPKSPLASGKLSQWKTWRT